MRTFDDSYRSKVFWVLLAIGIAILALMVAPFLPAILWAVVLSILIYPWYARLKQRMHPNMAATVATISTVLIIGVPLGLVGIGLFVQVNGFVRGLQSAAPQGTSVNLDYFIVELDKSFGPLAKSLSPEFSLKHWFDENRTELMGSLRAPLGKAAYSFGYAIFTFVIAFLTMFFMLRDGHRLAQPAYELLPLPEERSKQVFLRIAATVRAVFVGVVLVAIVQGTAAGIAYAVAGVPNAVMWGVATIVLCTIPLLGAPLLYIPMSLALIAQGKTGHGIGLALFGFLVVSNIDNLLRPFIIGQQITLHPMAVFFSLLGGVLLFGPVGIMAGPMVLTIVLALIEIAREMRKGVATESPRHSESISDA